MAVQNAFVTVAGLEAAAATETTLSYGPALQTIADLRAVPASARADKQGRLVEDVGATYRFDAQGVGADDGDLILAPDDGGPGRWFKVNPSSVPLSHAGSHEDGGADEINVEGLSGLLADAQKIEPQDEGVSLPLRKRINFTGVGVVATDDPGNDRTNIDVPGAIVAASFATQEDGASVQGATTFLNARKGIIASAGGANQAHLDLDYGGVAELADADAGAEAPGVSDMVPRADHKHSIPTAAAGTILPDDAAAAGSAATLARSDHKHAIAADVPGAILPDDTALEGVSTAFSRADHKHAIAADVPVDVTKAANAEGASTSFSRADHKHDVSTAAAGTIAVGDAAAEGAAATLARSDHKHALPAPAAPADVTKAAASAGAATTVARADHKHDVSTAAAIEITDSTNGEGSATSLSRSDHLHAHGSRGGGTLHAVATPSTAGFMSAADKTTLDGLVTENTLTTVNATEATIATIAIPADTAVLVEAYIVAKEAGGVRAGYVARALIYRTGAGAATVQGAVQSDFSRESNGALDVNIDVDGGNNGRVRVTGLAATTINWKSQHRTVQVA